MFPFQEGVLSAGNCEVGDYDQRSNNVTEDLNLLENNVSTAVGRSRGRGLGRGRKISVATSSSVPNNDDDEKKTMHREIERRRRQEMSNLYSSLRSILPAEYIKGKRSVCDHVAEAAKYIKDLEKNVKELGDRRAELKKSEENTCRTEPSCSSSPALGNNLVIREFPRGLEIEICVACGNEVFSLARVIQVIQEEGGSVMSCASRKINDRSIHDLICEVSNIDRNCINISQLHQRLIDLVD